MLLTAKLERVDVVIPSMLSIPWTVHHPDLRGLFGLFEIWDAREIQSVKRVGCPIKKTGGKLMVSR